MDKFICERSSERWRLCDWMGIKDAEGYEVISITEDEEAFTVWMRLKDKPNPTLQETSKPTVEI